MNLFVTGDIQVGKTTLIKLLLRKLDVEAGVFFTSRHYTAGQQDGFVLQDIREAGKPGAPVHFIARGSREAGWQPLPETLKTLGLQIVPVTPVNRDH